MGGVRPDRISHRDLTLMSTFAALPLFTLGLGLAQVQDGPQLTRLAAHGPDSALRARVRDRPDQARDALRELLARAASGPSEITRDSSIVAAERLAAAHAVAWRDSFFVRQVARFRSSSVRSRRTKVTADSLRLAGNDALNSGGVQLAMRRWRQSLRLFETILDTAGISAALGNLGLGFYQQEEFDSAQVYLSRSRALADRIGDYRTVGNALGLLGNVSKDRGDLRAAAELYRVARETRKRTGDARGLAADQNNLGLVAQDLGDFGAAGRAFAEALAANRAGGRVTAAATNLVNLGNIAGLEGRFSEAASHYREALDIYRANGNESDAALVLHNLGMLAVRRGDYRSATMTLSKAASVYRRENASFDEIAVVRDLVSARAAMGDLQRASADLRRAEGLAARLGSGAERTRLLAELALARGDLDVQFNRLRAAEREYARAERLSRGAGSEATRAAAQQGLGVVLLMREQYARARVTLELSLQAQVAASDARGAALTRLLMGYADRQRGDTAAARKLLLDALDALTSLGDVVGEAAALSALGDLDAQARLPLSAESLYHRGLARLGAWRVPGIAWQLHAGLGRALASRREMTKAASELRTAIAIIEQVSAPLTLEERRAAYRADKWNVYLDLALIERSRGQLAQAFETSERLRARQMLDLLARGRVANLGGVGEIADREQDLRRRIGELSQQLEASAAGDSGTRGPGPSGSQRGATLEALARNQEAYGELMAEIRGSHPAYSAVVRGEIASSDQVRRALTRDEALIEYLVGDSTTIVFVVTRDTVAAIDLNVSHEALAALVDFARGTLASSRAGAARQAWRAPLRRLYGLLLAPVEGRGFLAGKRRLLIAPHAELHYLPFAALVGPAPGGEVLVRRYVVDYVPSASVWLQLRARSPMPASSGVLALAPRPDALPGSRAEVAAIGRIYGKAATVLTGGMATERAFRAAATNKAIVHLATYGVLNKHNPLFSFVELGAGGTEDGRLEAHEVFGYSLNARLVVLSACQTGLAAGALADVPPGDDWVGLVRAFLFAGASNVVATLWSVEDLTTARLMERFYQGIEQGHTPGEALAVAQRGALEDARTSHPFYWAGFALAAGR